MKVEETQESQKQVGITFQRIPFETEIDIYPKMNPMVEGKGESSGEAGDMAPLTSGRTEERLKQAMQHQHAAPEDEFLPIPLKRIDSGPYQHHIQAPESATGTEVQPTENNNVHRTLVDEIDAGAAGPNTEAKGKSDKKSNTLTRMWKGIKVDKSSQDGTDNKLGAHVSISKIFQRINPVGMASRENFSKVFHRIGDALQKKTEGEVCSEAQSQTSDNSDSLSGSAKSGLSEQRNLKIGEKNFRCRPSNTNASKNSL